MKRKSKLFLLLLTILLFLAGSAIMLYPYFQGASADASMMHGVQSFS